jgi:hypothetical protein
MRLCQRCHRLHPLSDFSGNKHACKTALVALAASMSRRRLKTMTRDGSAGASGGGGEVLSQPPPPSAPRDAASSPENTSAATQGPALAVRACDADVVDWLKSVTQDGTPAHTTAAAAAAAAAASSSSVIAHLSVVAPGANLAAAAAALALHGFSMQVKLPQCASPASLPPPPALRAALAAALPDATLPPSCAILPGCVLLVVDALLEAALTAAMPPDSSAQAALTIAAALRASGLADHGAARGASVTVGGSRCALDAAAAPSVASVEVLRFWLAPRALLAGAEALPLAYRADVPITLAARCAGHHVRLLPEAAAQRVSVHAADATAAGPGALLLQAWGAGAAAASSAPRAVLLCGHDAALAAQVNATCERLGLQADDSSSSSSAALDAAMQLVIRVLGDALRPHAPLRLRQAAGAAAVWLGWHAAAAALVRVTQAEHEAAAARPQPQRGVERDAATVLQIHMAAHASAARAAGFAPSADAVMLALATASGAPLPEVAAAAWHLAGSALLRASHEDGHAEPGCAAAAAQRAVEDGDAAAECKAHALLVLRSVQSIAREREERAAAAEAAAAARDAEEEERERAYDAFLMVQNRFVWQTISALGLFGAVMYVVQAARQVAGRDDWPSANELAVSLPLIEATVLHRPAWVREAPRVMLPRDVPWAAVRWGTAAYVVFSFVVIIPSEVLLCLLAWRKATPQWRHAPLHFVLLALVDTNACLVCDLLVLHATGCATENPVAPPLFIRAVGTWLCVQRNMARPGTMHALFVHRIICYYGVLLATGNGRVVLTNYGHLANLLVVVYCWLTIGRRERRMRAEFEAHRAAHAKKAA